MISVFIHVENFNKDLFVKKFSYLGSFNFNPKNKELFPRVIVTNNLWEKKQFEQEKNSFFTAGLEESCVEESEFIFINSEGEQKINEIHEPLRFYGITYQKNEKDTPVVNFGVRSSLKNRCLFLDRDGVLNLDTSYPSSVKEIQIIKEAAKLISWANKNGYLVIVLTNQSGIARGYFDSGLVDEINQYIKKEFLLLGAKIDDFFVSPFHPQGNVKKYSLNSIYRKPLPGLLIKAIEKFDIDLGQSWMVGDKVSDKLKFFNSLTTLFLQGRYDLESTDNVFSTHDKILKRLMIE